MNGFKKNGVLLLGLATGLALPPIGHAATWALQGELKTHDPTLYKEDEVWWCLSTGPGIKVRFSTDGHVWQSRPALIDQADPWWSTYAPNQRPLDVWAPDLHAFAGRVWCYYCVSEFGRNNSAIGLRSCTSLVLADWRDDGLVLGSRRGQDAFNAIDPSLSLDYSGQPWLVFGSWFDGIHLVALDPATMKPTGPFTTVAQRMHGIEAPNIVYENGYYYLFVSVDRCCQGVKSTYKIAYGRAKTITGPYLDQANVALTAGGGTVLDSGDGRWIGPGGQSVIKADGKWLIARHAYDANDKGVPTLLISDLYWDSEYWPTYRSEK